MTELYMKDIPTYDEFGNRKNENEYFYLPDLALPVGYLLERVRIHLPNFYQSNRKVLKNAVEKRMNKYYQSFWAQFMDDCSLEGPDSILNRADFKSNVREQIVDFSPNKEDPIFQYLKIGILESLYNDWIPQYYVDAKENGPYGFGITEPISTRTGLYLDSSTRKYDVIEGGNYGFWNYVFNMFLPKKVKKMIR